MAVGGFSGYDVIKIGFASVKRGGSKLSGGLVRL